MNALNAYAIPFLGLKNGIHSYEFVLDSAFFSHFEASPVEDGSVNAKIEMDRRADMLIFDLVLDGTVKATCDRCTAGINLPIAYDGQLLVKFGEADSDDDEVVFIERDESVFNVAQFLYESVVMSLPFIIAYDCENDPEPPCNFEVLSYLSSDSEAQKAPNPLWDDLKNLDN